MSIYSELRHNIQERFTEALLAARAAGELDFAAPPSFTLEEPRERAHGDLAVNAAMLLAKETRKAPRAVAEIILRYLRPEGVWIAETSVAGPGFINLRLDPAWLAGVLPEIFAAGPRYGASDMGRGQKVQVEFVSANPTGLLHMGNARGAALGDSLAALLSFAGYETEREFYINDTGNQIHNLALSLEARYFQILGREGHIPENGYHGEDITETVRDLIARDGEVYLDMDAADRREALTVYALTEKIAAMRRTLSDFGVDYDVWFSEKYLHTSGYVRDTLAALTESGHTVEREGALWLKGVSLGEEKDEVMIRSDGTPTYFAADIAYHRHKFARGFTRLINVWGADHHGHVARMRAALGALGLDPGAFQVVLMQFVRLIEGGEVVKMSKRSGRYITLRELITEVGRDAARFFFLMRAPDSTVDFDLDLAKKESAENPVFYVQYAHARVCSIIRRAQALGLETEQAPPPAALALLANQWETDLLRQLALWPEVVAVAAERTEPHRLTGYLIELAGLYHSFNNSCRVLQAKNEDLRSARLALVWGVRRVIANALAILGVSAPESM
ncbi:MAG: arginine--tRNA ligase [Gracilibacteraceae bacterium]|jgi:arginyl-tRNA synthetase|nr:arginine--tRNA ligase [Gracilibacteraceae bacterium]